MQPREPIQIAKQQFKTNAEETLQDSSSQLDTIFKKAIEKEKGYKSVFLTTVEQEILAYEKTD